MTGTPVFQYKIQYEAWYFIVTSSGLHFYFNKSKRKSYWQLYDVFEDNPGIDQNEFINCINMEDIALLMCRVNGLKGLDGYFFKESKRNEKDLQKKSIDVDSINTRSRDEEGVEEEIVDKQGTIESEEEEEEVVEYDKDAKEEFIRNLLLEEGYIQEEAEKKDEETSDVLNLGYSSSEDDSEAEEDRDIKNDQDDNNEEEIRHNDIHDDKRKNTDEDHNETDLYQDQIEEKGEVHNEEKKEEKYDGEQSEEDHDEHNIHDADDSDDETQGNRGLDLSLSEDEIDATKEFLQLLDSYKDRISVYDPWFLIEEELLPELITKPEYYSIDDSSERERIFNQWCKSQQDEPQETITDAGVQQSEVYPTVTQMYFRYLQNHKKELKKYFYSEFSTKFSNEIDLTFGELLAKERESLYRQYKIMITDYAEYEKKMKKSGLNDANLKKLKLITFLNKNRKCLSNNAKRKDVLEVENSTEDAFSKWAKICNLYNIPTLIGNNVENFIVGDEKRLQSYIETITRS